MKIPNSNKFAIQNETQLCWDLGFVFLGFVHASC
jgi:hypothetical protein